MAKSKMQQQLEEELNTVRVDQKTKIFNMQKLQIQVDAMYEEINRLERILNVK